MMPRICIIIVNYNTGLLLSRCLDSIRAQKESDCRVIVVDNASVDKSLELIRSGYPEVLLIGNDRNLGFAAANNQAIRETEAELLFFLNPDTELQPGCLAEIRAFMAAHPEVGLAGPAIVNSDGSHHSTVEERYPGSHYTCGEVDELPGDIAWILGAALIASRSVIAEVGGFDERFFLYAEDIDLCLEIRKRNWLLGYIANAKVLHLEGQSEKKAPFADVIERKVRAELIFFKKHYRSETVAKIRRARLLQAWWRILSLGAGGLFFGAEDAHRRKQIKYAVIARLYGQASPSEDR
ncbi:MAG: glycosyltransferase family 2 protein [Desulfobulbaceae bacterium]|nr:glycosyltransferase family 2 protein [Desulfobulbaceae bacterium]